MHSITRPETETSDPDRDGAAAASVQFWELPTRKQKRSLSRTLVDVLHHYAIDEDDFAQEIAIALWQSGTAVLCEPDTGRVLETSESPYLTYQRWTFRNLIKPFRKKKRGERVVPYSDPQWQRPGDRAPFLFRTSPMMASVSISDLTDTAAYCHNPEAALALRVDVARLLDRLSVYPEPLVLAAFGWIPSKEAVAQTGFRSQTGWEQLRQIREAARSFLGEYRWIEPYSREAKREAIPTETGLLQDEDR